MSGPSPGKRARLDGMVLERGEGPGGGKACLGAQGRFRAGEGAVARYEGWLRETGAWWAAELVEIRSPWREYSTADNVPDFLRDGWGLMSRDKKIKKGTVICKVPMAASFRGDNGTRCSEEKDSQLHLALRLMREQRKGPASTVWSKIQTLPSGVPVCWAWTAEEREWLAGSELELVVRRKLDRLKSEFLDVVEPLGEGWTEAEYVDACATIISHANPWWGVSSVAFVDMGNHADDPHVEFRQRGSHVVGTVVKTIPRLSEIFQSYGELGSADLLYRYGFTRGESAAPHPEDVVSIDMSILHGCGCRPGAGAGAGAMDLRGRENLLQKCNVVDQSPWDGLEDVLTIQIAPLGEERAAQGIGGGTGADGGLEGAAMRLSGLGELLVGCRVMTMEDGDWQRLQAVFECAKKDVRASADAPVGEEDCAMLALYLALQHMNEGDAASLREGAAGLLARLSSCGVRLSADDCVLGEPGPGGAESSARSEAGGARGERDENEIDDSDGDEDNTNELDWMCLVGEFGQNAPWLQCAPVLAAARRALEARSNRLARPLPAEQSQHPDGSDPHKARLLGMARCIRQLETAVLAAALGAVEGLEVAASRAGSVSAARP